MSQTVPKISTLVAFSVLALVAIALRRRGSRHTATKEIDDVVQRLATNKESVEQRKQRVGCVANQIGEAFKVLNELELKQTFWVGICGVPGAGKTTFAGELCEQLRRRLRTVAVVPMDGYHYERKVLDTFPDPKLAHDRRGAPFTFDAQRFARDMKDARKLLEQEGKASFFPSFDHAVKDPVERGIMVPADAEIVIVEGNYLLLDETGWRDARDVLDRIYFLSVDLRVAKQRLAARHAQVWNWPLERAMRRVEESDYLNMVLINTTMDRANEVITNE
jgi:pantothenate kinase